MGFIKAPYHQINLRKESILTYILSESSLAKDWATEKENDAWKNP